MEPSWCSQYPRTIPDSVPTHMSSQMYSQSHPNSITLCVVFALELLSQHLSSHPKKPSRLSLFTISSQPTHNTKMFSMVFTRLFNNKVSEVSTRDISQPCLSNQPIRELDSSYSRIHRNSCKTISHGKYSAISYQEPSLDSVQLCSTTQLMSSKPIFKVLRQPNTEDSLDALHTLW